MPRHTVYTKNALRPIPGASPKGSLPIKAIARHPMIAARAVDVNTAPPGISSSPNNEGFTARIYAIVKKVVIPAMISVLTVVLVESNPNSFFSIFV